MTTIAADFATGIMVSDSKCTYGSTWSPITKIFRIDGNLVGCAGDVKEWMAFIKWQRSGRKGPRPKGGNYVALIMRRDAIYQFDGCNGCEMPIERGFHAVGSGAHAAIGAMMAGAGARQATNIACLIDPESGGDVKVFHFNKAEQ